jgi:hypothetical protein
MLTEGGATDSDRIAFAFRLVATRSPKPAELQMLVSALAEYRTAFENDSKTAPARPKKGKAAGATNLPPVGLAAATALANVLLNLDEVTTRE